MDLLPFVNNDTTDKNTIHSYIPIYSGIMQSKRQDAENILEIGVRDGGSIQLWHDYFKKARIWGLDIEDALKPICADLKQKPRVHLDLNTDAYTEQTIKKLAVNKFDFIIDDGPHTLDSQQYAVKNYPQLLKDDGCLIVEDVQCVTWIPELFKQVPEHLKKFCFWVDLRQVPSPYKTLPMEGMPPLLGSWPQAPWHTKGRYDDIMFIINKSMQG